MAESDVDDEFTAVTSNIIANAKDKCKLKRNKSQIISQSRACHFLAWNSTVMESAPESGTRRIWFQICTTHVPETGARKLGVDLWRQFLERVL